jgi:hypothetical protein
MAIPSEAQGAWLYFFSLSLYRLSCPLRCLVHHLHQQQATILEKPMKTNLVIEMSKKLKVPDLEWLAKQVEKLARIKSLRHHRHLHQGQSRWVGLWGVSHRFYQRYFSSDQDQPLFLAHMGAKVRFEP